jgi:uncharacterized protein YkwD
MAIAASALMAIPAVPASARAHPATAFDQRLLADINAVRAARGVAPLVISSQLQPAAASWAQHLADTGLLANNPRLRQTMNAACPGWRYIGEAVGVAGESSADDLFHAYMRDADQRHTLLTRRVHAVGIATVATQEDGSTVNWNAIELANRCGS